MSTIILVHGSWHGAWCWSDLARRLAEKGHSVLARDLPGHGEDKTALQLLTLEGYVQSVIATIDSVKGPVILLGHSFGGLVISQAAEYRANRIQALVYLSAYLPRNGESASDLTMQDKDSRVPSHLLFADDYSSFHINPETVEKVFYEDCGPENLMLAKSRLQPEAMGPFREKARLTDANFGSIERIYMTTLYDHAISPELQKKMYTLTPCEQVISLRAAHCTFVFDSEELLSRLVQLFPA
ncbi:alpha/beta fold hydrolase [Paenibacillus hodogayensis]|uniref:Alpha/beta fold hydrolase n=1 Tax=Paenibacillus hodogayensis TaxID=279208 RepID=A0ABV5W3H3_9BACL